MTRWRRPGRLAHTATTLAAIALAGSVVVPQDFARALSPTAPTETSPPAETAPPAASGPPAGSGPPAASGPITLSAEPMLGGMFHLGSWAAIRVHVENDGPAIDGELRLTGTARASSTYAVAIQLPTGARQEHVLYGETLLGGRLQVALVSGDSELGRIPVRLDVTQQAEPGVYVVAERPELLVGPLRAAVSSIGGTEPRIVTVSPRDLPPRAEPWASVDLLVWRDVDSSTLDAEQLEALRTWLLTGGHLVIVAGSTGASSLNGFPPDLLPYRPTSVVDVPAADVEAMLGSPPSDGAPIPALSGTLERGVEIGRSGDHVVAARAPYGQGIVSLIGLDPTTPALAGSPAGGVLWDRTLAAQAPGDRLELPANDGFLANSLNNIPAVQLPPMEQLLVLVLAYIIAIGPLNYVLLRRRDRREWAWLTMPLTIVVFAVGAYVFGVSTKGASVIVNEVAIVHGATGADRGLARVHVGIYSPGRGNFDVRVGGRALPSTVARDPWMEDDERPIDVLLGDPATIRAYGVGFGSLRTFRADASVLAPRLDVDLRLADLTLTGTLVNSSDRHLSDVSLVYGGAVEVIGDFAPGQSHAVDMVVVANGAFNRTLADRLYPRADTEDVDEYRTIATRRAAVQYLEGGWEGFGPWDVDVGMPSSSSVFDSGAIVLAWESAPTLTVDVGAPSEHLGERLFLLRARTAVAGPVVFSGGLVGRSTLSVDAVEGYVEGASFMLNRGTMTADYRPLGFEGSFSVANLLFRLGGETSSAPTAGGVDLAPLPADEQPDAEAPLTSNPRPDGGSQDVPRIQLFDRVAGTWVEFEPAQMHRTYRIPDPGRYVDQSATFRVRFVIRELDAFAQFSFQPRIEGTVE